MSMCCNEGVVMKAHTFNPCHREPNLGVAQSSCMLQAAGIAGTAPSKNTGRWSRAVNLQHTNLQNLGVMQHTLYDRCLIKTARSCTLTPQAALGCGSRWRMPPAAMAVCGASRGCTSRALHDASCGCLRAVWALIGPPHSTTSVSLSPLSVLLARWCCCMEQMCITGGITQCWDLHLRALHSAVVMFTC